MKVEKNGGKGLKLELDASEAKLLRRALERANYIDTPPDEQEAILNFCAKALDQIAAVERK